MANDVTTETVPTGPAPTDDAARSDTAAPTPGDVALVEEELLVEEVSIDGMCGVY